MVHLSNCYDILNCLHWNFHIIIHLLAFPLTVVLFEFLQIANQFEILIWNSWLTSKSLSYLTSYFTSLNTCCLCFFFTESSLVILQLLNTIAVRPCCDTFHSCLNLPLLAETWPTLLCAVPSREIQLCLCTSRHGKVMVLATRFLDVTKCTNLTQLLLLISCKFQFSVAGIVFYPTSSSPTPKS
jgi:hypothetical protein